MVDSGSMSQDELFAEQESEIEALKYIFLDDLEVLEERPFKLEILLNANNESADKNYLKLKLIIDLKEDYPHSVPHIIIKNLTPDIINNNLMIDFERLVLTKAEESIGTQMIYDVCEALREQISTMNEKILDKLKELDEKDSINNALKQVTISQDAPLTFTPVNKETFGKWCEMYKEKMRKMKEEMRSELDAKPSGREIFELNKKVIGEINIEEQDEDDEEFKEGEAGDEEEDQDFTYDRALYVQDEQEEEVDFD